MPLRTLLSTPGVLGPFSASMIGRLPMTAMGLLLIADARLAAVHT